MAASHLMNQATDCRGEKVIGGEPSRLPARCDPPAPLPQAALISRARLDHHQQAVKSPRGGLVETLWSRWDVRGTEQGKGAGRERASGEQEQHKQAHGGRNV